MTLVGREWLASRSDRFTPGTHGMIRWLVIEPEDGSARQWKVGRLRFSRNCSLDVCRIKLPVFFGLAAVGYRRPKSILRIGGSIAVLSVETVSNCLVAVIVIIIVN